jgi:hypothetical protein
MQKKVREKVGSRKTEDGRRKTEVGRRKKEGETGRRSDEGTCTTCKTARSIKGDRLPIAIGKATGDGEEERAGERETG